ncbi:MAG TPA: BTAD domain-containing putative transcriptional regulator [Streptosporangiaceae bacterium]
MSIGVVRDLEQGRTTRLHAESARRLAQALGLDHGQTAKLAGPAGVSSGSAAPGRQARLRISVLGSLRVWRDGADIAIGGVMPRAVLGLLVLHPETGQRRESLIDALGGTGDDPPATAVAMIQSYVSRLRRWLDPGAMGARSGGLLAAAVGGYRLRDAACELDHVTFAALADHAQTARSAGDLAAACDAYARALALWRGEPLAAALGVYEQLRRRLDDQLGVLPGPELAAAHSRVLHQHIPQVPPRWRGSPWCTGPAPPQGRAAPSRRRPGSYLVPQRISSAGKPSCRR